MKFYDPAFEGDRNGSYILEKHIVEKTLVS